MARRPKNPINDVGNAVGAWFGNAVKGVQSYSESQARTFTNPYVNLVGKAFGKNPNLPVSNRREAITNTAFAVADIATPAVGRVVSRTAGRAVAKVVESGRVINPAKAIRNVVQGEKVVIHGTPKNIVGNALLPKAETWGSEVIGKPVVFALDPRQVNAKKMVGTEAYNYAQANQIVVGKTKKNLMKSFDEFQGFPNNSISNRANYLYSEQPIPIQRSVSANNSRQQVLKDLQRALRKEGVSLRGQSVADRVEEVVKKIKKQNKPKILE